MTSIVIASLTTFPLSLKRQSCCPFRTDVRTGTNTSLNATKQG